jgi:hypothetical protein
MQLGQAGSARNGNGDHAPPAVAVVVILEKVLRSAKSPAELAHAGELVKDNEDKLTPAGKDRLRITIRR